MNTSGIIYKVEITECCLRTGYNCRFDTYFPTLYEAHEHVENFLTKRKIPLEKYYRKHKMCTRGTAEGIKVFWSPYSGTRYYLFINVFEEKRLA